MEFLKFGDVLNAPDKYLWTDALYLPIEDTWDKSSNCLILDPEETDDPDDDPVVAKENGLRYALSMQDVQSVMRNAKSQKSSLSVDDLVKAVEYYFLNDAFLVFE